MEFKEKLAAMRPLSASRLPEYSEIDTKDSPWSTINIKSNAYSMPSQLIGDRLRVRLFDTRLEVYLGGKLQMTVERLTGKQQHAINYRHIIDSLIKKPEHSSAIDTVLTYFRGSRFVTPTTRWSS